MAAESDYDWHELPEKLQQLLVDLEDNALSELPDLDGEEYGNFFVYGASNSSDGRHGRVRNRVLTAIGQCRSLRSPKIIEEWEIGIDREDECVVLLGALASNPSLESLDLSWCKGFATLAGCKALGQLIASSRSLRRLEARGIGVDATGLGALVEGFFNKDCVLEYLNLSRNSVGDAEGAQHLARMLATAPRLKTLDLRRIGMDEAGAQFIANALPLCATLRKLYLDALDPTDQDTVWGLVQGSLGPVSSVLKLAFTRAGADAAISGVTKLILDISDSEKPGLADALSGMLRTNDRITKLEINLSAVECGLGAWRHNSTLSKLNLVEFRDGDKSLSEFSMSFLDCKSLRVLTLRRIFWPTFMKALMQSLEKRTSLNELNIVSCDDLDDELSRELMQFVRASTTLRKLNMEGTECDWEENAAIIRATLARNATQSDRWGRIAEEEKEEDDWSAMPAELQQLVEHLEGNALSELPYWEDECYRDYFPEPHPWCIMDGHYFGELGRRRRHWRVRKRVLTAIGHCRSLGDDLTFFAEWEIGIVQEDECAVLLGALASNPCLETLCLDESQGFGTLAGCKALGQLIASSRSLRRLEVSCIGLDATGLGALVDGFFNKDCVLEYLNLGHNRVGNAEGAQHLARMMATAPRLNTLDLCGIGMDEAGAQCIANALPLCATLRELYLDDIYSCAGYSSSRVLQGSLGSISTVLKLAFTRADADAAISGVTKLSLYIPDKGEPGLADALEGMLRTNDRITELSIQGFSSGMDGISYGMDGSSSGIEYRLDVDDEFPMFSLECKSLRILTLMGICWPSFMKALLQSLEKNTSLKELRIMRCYPLDDYLFRELMQSLQVNTTLQKMDIVSTDWGVEGKQAIIDATLERNATHKA